MRYPVTLFLAVFASILGTHQALLEFPLEKRTNLGTDFVLRTSKGYRRRIGTSYWIRFRQEFDWVRSIYTFRQDFSQGRNGGVRMLPLEAQGIPYLRRVRQMGRGIDTTSYETNCRKVHSIAHGLPHG